MNRKGSVQIKLIIFTVLLIGAIVFALFKFGVIEKDVGEEKIPSKVIVQGMDDETKEDGSIESEDEYDIAVGREAPNFTLKNLKGEDVSLEDYRGKIILLNFWATWCGFCDKEMPDMQKLSKDNDDLVVLAVDVMEKEELVKDYIEKGGYDFEVVLDEDGNVAKTYLVSSFPTSYFIDKDGILLGGVPAMMTGPQMNEMIGRAHV